MQDDDDPKWRRLTKAERQQALTDHLLMLALVLMVAVVVMMVWRHA